MASSSALASHCLPPGVGLIALCVCVCVCVCPLGVGLIAPGDISLATTTAPPAIVLGFGVKPDKGVENMARREGVDLVMSEVIYDLMDDVQERLDEGWGKKTETLVMGQAEVLKVFALRGKLKGTVIAGESRRKTLLPSADAAFKRFWSLWMWCLSRSLFRSRPSRCAVGQRQDHCR